MLVDFCHWSLQPSVSCDKPSSDGYEVQNLISSDSSARRRGFLAETFIKPPVNITFTFPCKVCIHQLFINPVVGAQKSTSLEIYTASNKINSSWLGQFHTSQPGSRGRLFDSPFFLNIGKMSLREPCRVCFTNPRFNATAPYSIDGISLDGCHTSTLRNHRHQYLTAVSQLSVRITQTSGSCVPALKSIEIFGQPALSNGHQILQKVYYKYFEGITPVVNPVEEKKSETVEDVKVAKVEENGLEIPEDFLDPITWDIMALPMLLPCGKSLDQSTLEKYVNNEASWGRRPNDPFTGVAFSAQVAPVVNETLKTRVDAFLLKHSNDLKVKTVARTVGRNIAMATDHSKSSSAMIRLSVSKIVNENASGKRNLPTENVHVPAAKKLKVDKSGKHSVCDDNKHGNTGSCVSKIVNTSSTVVKRNLDSEHTHIVSEHTRIASGHTHIAMDTRLKGDNAVKCSGGEHENSVKSISKHSAGDISSRPLLQSHDSQLSSSLSQAMSVLSGLPSFTKKNMSRQQPTDYVCVCVGCRSVIDNSVPAYKLECSHVICRHCLLKPGSSSTSTVTCGQCDMPSQVSQVTRVHVV